MVTMSQKSSVLQPAKSVSRLLTPNNNLLHADPIGKLLIFMIFLLSDVQLKN